MLRMRHLCALCFWGMSFWSSMHANADELKLKTALEKYFPDIRIQIMDVKTGFSFCWELTISQKLDHWNEQAGKFSQKIYLYHKSFKKPNILVTEGYNIQDRIYESTLILDGNQFSIEYRYFGDSRPDTLNWSLLNHKQALEDLHVIKSKLAKIYKKSWVVTGISKGGTTAALYSLIYPEDIQAAVAYVAPFVLAQEDQRTVEHYRNKAGTPACRKKIIDFQRNLLLHRKEIKIKLVELEKKEEVFFPMDKDKVIDFTAMEYPFSFWQWGFGCQEIPEKTADAQTIFEHIEEVVDFNYYDNKTCKEFLPAYYQFMTEFGYYGFDTSGIGDLILYPNLSNLEFCPENTDLSYHGEYMNRMHHQAVHKSKNIIYIYGGLDTWTSCAVNPSEKTNAIKLVKYDGAHRTRIRDFSEGEKQKVYSALQKWTKSKTKALPY